MDVNDADVISSLEPAHKAVVVHGSYWWAEMTCQLFFSVYNTMYHHVIKSVSACLIFPHPIPPHPRLAGQDTIRSPRPDQCRRKFQHPLRAALLLRGGGDKANLPQTGVRDEGKGGAGGCDPVIRHQSCERHGPSIRVRLLLLFLLYSTVRLEAMNMKKRLHEVGLASMGSC